ncbi:N-acetylglucosamine-6-phosphate deacetylase [Mycoplasmoides fastidiosum]|uniref:N-acetylglucosamine-6-phosphate deacetylase n=1 Tax=Mycoplasmoides fastidiosum TaxID=92758 RepID=A0ABU0LZW2_9BACT|nr:N-acetylglucosamine-6-phosphate deacetylase [Mycoplasmoides fastidiosum]MDQ0514251.1 N-acetylglucosamine-6-phosphate deacetylase [Mycoplasmoides fastidiosum]UUD37341.1 N-acetylglucosamine-6-phosphate deacetylase [Mycoplasmoides fastidiosum]
MILKNALITTIQKQFRGWIEIIDNQITQINRGKTDQEGIDCQGLILMPGFIDSHTHGGYNWSFNDIIESDYEKKLLYYEQEIIKEGVSAVLATTVTCSRVDLRVMMEKYRQLFQQEHNFNYLGWYIEGPFISVEKKGAHEADLINSIDLDFLSELQNHFSPNQVCLTIAPETNALELLKQFQNYFIFSIGHSNDYQFSRLGIQENCFKRITHLYNAMSGFDHRKTGIVNVVLENKKWNIDFCIELISDGYHTTNSLIDFTYRVLGTQNLSVVSDSLPAKGLANGLYKLNNLDILKKDDVFYLKDMSSLAGSGMKYNKVVKHFKDVTNCSWSELVKVSSYNAAKNLQLENQYGNIAIGHHANLVLVNSDLDILLHVLKGKVVVNNLTNLTKNS